MGRGNGVPPGSLTAAEIAALYESNLDTNKYTNSDNTAVNSLAYLPEGAQFLNYSNLDLTVGVVTDLENHATLPQLGLFTTEYTHNTIVELDTQLTVRDSTGTKHNIGDVLAMLLALANK